MSLLGCIPSVPPLAPFISHLTSAQKVCSPIFCEMLILTQAGGSTSRTWAFRSCVITGTQQLLISFLLYWGAPTRSANGGMTSSPPPSAAVIAGVAFPLAVLMCSIGALLFLGLPSYYRQKPGAVPSMYRSLCRRSIVIVRLIYPFSFGPNSDCVIVVLDHGYLTNVLALYHV
jgi:hypothetical protein